MTKLLRFLCILAVLWASALVPVQAQTPPPADAAQAAPESQDDTAATPDDAEAGQADDASDADAAPDEAAQDPETLAGGPLADTATPPVTTTPPAEQPAPKPAPVKSADPIEALTDTAESATEAASELVVWLRSGQREALIAVALVLGLTLMQYFLRWGILKGIVRLPRMDDYSIAALIQRVVSRFHVYFMIAISLALANSVMPFPAAISGFAKIFLVLAAVLQMAVWVQEFALSAIKRNVHRNTGDAVALASAFNIIKWFITFAIWTVALLLILDNVGTDVTALLAGLGIGGVALGFAAQGIFRDVFSSLSIVIDKPFQVGDTVRYGDTWGAIEEIGLKTTRIRARSGEQIIISNTALLELEIHNMARMSRRRIETGFGVIYQTPPDVAEKIPGLVAEMVKGVQGVDFDRCGLSGFGPSSLDYSLVFYSLNPEFNRSMAARSRVLLALFRLFKDQGIDFAYPTQTLYIEGMEDNPAARTLQVLKGEV